MFFVKILNLFYDVPVFPNEGSRMYLDCAMVDHSEYCLRNSKRLIKINTPNNLRISPFSVGLLLFLISCPVVNVEIKFNSTWVNIN